MNELDAVSFQVGADGALHQCGYRSCAPAQHLEGDVEIDICTDAIQVAPPEPRNVQRRLAKGFRRDSGAADRRAARFGAPLYHRDLLAKIRSVRCTLLPGRPAADHDQVELVHHSLPPMQVAFSGQPWRNRLCCTDQALRVHCQSTRTTSTGFAIPFSVTSRGSLVAYLPRSTVLLLARISLAPAKAEIRAASCTPMPRNAPDVCVASEACKPIRSCGAKPLVLRFSARRRWMATAQATAASGLSNPTKNPSPAVSITSPP